MCLLSDLNPILNFLQNNKSNPLKKKKKKPSEPVWTKSKPTYFLKQLNCNKTQTSKYFPAWIDMSFVSSLSAMFSISGLLSSANHPIKEEAGRGRESRVYYLGQVKQTKNKNCNQLFEKYTLEYMQSFKEMGEYDLSERRKCQHIML